MSNILSIAPFDFHVHTGISHDATGTVMEYCEKAVALGMKAIGFCEHVDLDPRDPASGLHDYDRYAAEIEEARGRFGESLTIRMGAEVGYVPRIRKEIADYLNARSYDYVTGSVHSIYNGECGISDEYEATETFARRNAAEAYLEYFAAAAEMVVSGLFDVVGHLDLIQRYGCGYLEDEPEWGRYYGQLRRVFEGAMKREMAIEINTSGLREKPESTYPCRAVLDLYRELGGRDVMVGSDAHSPEHLGAGIPVAIKLARELRIDRFLAFHRREPAEIF